VLADVAEGESAARRLELIGGLIEDAESRAAHELQIAAVDDDPESSPVDERQQRDLEIRGSPPSARTGRGLLVVGSKVVRCSLGLSARTPRF
jgi:hypothetical protein